MPADNRSLEELRKTTDFKEYRKTGPPARTRFHKTKKDDSALLYWEALQHVVWRQVCYTSRASFLLAIEWLTANRKIKAIGVDLASIDYGHSKDFKTHQVFYGANIPGFEKVENMDKLSLKSSYIIALPMKIKRGSGAPLRIVAWLKN